jgi:ATP-dependent Clp protease, protease subunit
VAGRFLSPHTLVFAPLQAPGSDYAQFVSIEAAMYRDRTMMINRFIDEQAANNIISIMLYLRNESPRDKISLYFNVPGGHLRPSLAIYDLIQNTKKTCEIETVNLALCAGMGAVLCSAGTKGKRSAMPNSRFLLQRIGMDNVFRGQATDIALEVRNVKSWNDRMETELSQLTGQDVERIAKDLQRDFYLSADEAVQYGLIDQVLLPAPRKRAARGGEANLGAFDGDNAQRYQSKTTSSGGGWGSQQQQTPPTTPPKKKSSDDEEPKTAQ